MAEEEEAGEEEDEEEDAEEERRLSVFFQTLPRGRDCAPPCSLSGSSHRMARTTPRRPRSTGVSRTPRCTPRRRSSWWVGGGGVCGE